MLRISLFFIVYILLQHSNFVKPQDILTNNIGSDSFVINQIVDELIKYAKIIIKDKNMDRTPVPDLVENFTALGIDGTFLASNGSVAYLSTIKRTGDARIIYGKSVTTLSLDLGLDELVVDYNYYKAKYLDIGPTGIMRVTVAENSVYASFELHYNFRNCTEDLATIFMDKFDGIDIKLTGLNPLNWLLDDIAKWIEKDFHDKIRYLIEDNLKIAVKNAMVKYNLCKYIPHIPNFGTKS